MRLQVRPLALLSGLRIRRCRAGCRRGSDPALLWFWHRPVATAPIQPLPWEPPYASGVALEKTKKKKRKRESTTGSLNAPGPSRDRLSLTAPPPHGVSPPGRPPSQLQVDGLPQQRGPWGPHDQRTAPPSSTFHPQVGGDVTMAEGRV